MNCPLIAHLRCTHRSKIHKGPSVNFRICQNTGMPVWGRGGGFTLPVCKKCKNEKKKKKKKKRRKEEERDKERELHRHDVWSKLPLCFTNGGRDLRTVRTHTSLFGGRGPGRCLEGSVPAKTGKNKRANKTTPTRHLPDLPNAFDIYFTWGLPLSFPLFLEAQVGRAIVLNIQQTTSGRFQRRARKKKKFGKNYQGLAIASRREAITRFVTEVEELARQFETRSLTWRRATRGTASKNEWSTMLCRCEHGV